MYEDIGEMKKVMGKGNKRKSIERVRKKMIIIRVENGRTSERKSDREKNNKKEWKSRRLNQR